MTSATSLFDFPSVVSRTRAKVAPSMMSGPAPPIPVQFNVATAQHVKISIYDMSGRWVTDLTDRVWQTGRHSLNWNGRDAALRAVSSGTYVVRLEQAGSVQSRKMTLLR